MLGLVQYLLAVLPLAHNRFPFILTWARSSINEGSGGFGSS